MGLCVLQARHWLCSLFWTIFSRMFIQRTALVRQKLSSSRAESRHTYYLLLEQRAGMLTAHNKIFQISKLKRVFSSNKTHYVNRCYLALSAVPCGNWDPEHWHKWMLILWLLLLLWVKKLLHLCLCAFHQHKSLSLLSASIKLWQAYLLASSRVKSQILYNFWPMALTKWDILRNGRISMLTWGIITRRIKCRNTWSGSPGRGNWSGDTGVGGTKGFLLSS